MARDAPVSMNSADRRSGTEADRPHEVFRRHQKEVLVKDANIMALSGLAAVGLAISAAVLLVVSYVAKGLPAVIITVFVACLFAGLWFALPLARRRSRFPQ